MADLPKRTLEVIPGVGVPPVRFGMTEAAVRRLLGDPDREYPRVWFYHECGVMLNFDEIGEVSFVEVSWRSDCDVRYNGISVFYTPAEELVRLISGELPATEADTFTNDELGLGLWRPVLPSEYYPEDPDDEYRKGVYWLTIAIWKPPSRGGSG